MNHQRPRSDWACEKVRVFVPPIREKGVLLAIAGHAHHDGTSSYCGIDTIVHETGLSRATVHRHIKFLEKVQLLEVRRGGRGPCDSNHYFIPCCALGIEDLEILTGVSGRQLVLPIAHDEGRSDVTVGEVWQPIAVAQEKPSGNRWLRELESHRETLKGIMVRQEGYHGETQTQIQNQVNQPGLGLILKEKGSGSGKGKAFNRDFRPYNWEVTHPEPGEGVMERSEEAERLYQEAMRKLEFSMLNPDPNPRDRGAHMRGEAIPAMYSVDLGEIVP